jgi:putative ABC transport system permease protein
MRLYRALLHLYPASFRQEWGDGMSQVFAMRARSVSGPLRPLVLAAMALADVVPNALAAHWDVLRQDLRYAARSLRRSWGFALTAVLVVALGVGANTAAFSVADTVLLRPLPFREPARIVKVWQKTPGYGRFELSPANWRDWRASARSFSTFGAVTFTAYNLVGLGEPVRVQATSATADVLPMLGVQPLVGRLPAAVDSGGPATVVLSHALWRRQFGGDPGVVGRAVRLDGNPFVVVAVMPPEFNFPTRETEVWTRLDFDENAYSDRTNTYIHGIGRLRPGATLEQAQAEMDAVARRLATTFPENEGVGARLYLMGDEVGEQSRLLLGALVGAALCILLLACANVGNLLIARAASREREMAVRAALGAGGARLVRQLLTESLLLTALGGAAGVLVAWLAVPALTRLVPSTLPLAAMPTVDGRVLAFAAALTALVGIAFGVLPAMGGVRRTSFAALRDGGRSGAGRRRARSVLVAVQVMASVVLLVTSGLLVRAMWRLQQVDPGFRAEGVLTARTALPLPKYADPADRVRFYDRVLGEVRALPGVQSAAYVTGLPMGMRGGIWPAILPGEPENERNDEHATALRYATPQYFATLGIPLLRGRDIADSDDRQSPFVAVVSESFVRRRLAGREPIGQTIKIAFFDRTIVGVVGDVRQRGLEQESEPQIYVPPAQIEPGWMPFYAPKDLVVRATVPPTSLTSAVRRIVHAADPDQPVSNIRTMEELVGGETASRAAQLRVLGALATVALLLAGVGIHGLLSFTVALRSREIGVRLALGARPRSIVRMVLGEGLALAAAGILPGVLVAWWAGRAMQALLAGVRPTDPVTFGVAVFACAATVVVGCLRPAARAGRVDPMVALRAE